MECWCDKDGYPPKACPLHGVVDWQYIAASRGVEIGELRDDRDELYALLRKALPFISAAGNDEDQEVQQRANDLFVEIADLLSAADQ